MEKVSIRTDWIRYLLLATVFVLFGLLVRTTQTIKGVAQPHIDLQRIPMKISGWEGENIPVSAEINAILETRNVLMREYNDGAGSEIVIAIVYYKDSRIALHLPESCLMGQGGKLVERKEVPVGFSDKTDVHAMQLLTVGTSEDYAIRYYFQTGEYITSSYLDFRKKMMWNKLGKVSRGGALVRFSVETSPATMQLNLERLTRFIHAIGPMLSEYLE